ncbi:hypothetical protein [Pseudomonas batumici]|nr:hypothetical protein [Pseudomonas batumici]
MKVEMALYKALVASNVPEQHATAVIDAMEKEMTSVLATKADLTALRTELKADITTVHTELKADIATLRADLKTEISEVRNALTTDGEKRLKELANLENKLTLRMILLLSAFGSLLFGALKYLN